MLQFALLQIWFSRCDFQLFVQLKKIMFCNFNSILDNSLFAWVTAICKQAVECVQIYILAFIL